MLLPSGNTNTHVRTTNCVLYLYVEMIKTPPVQPRIIQRDLEHVAQRAVCPENDQPCIQASLECKIFVLQNACFDGI